MSTKRDNSRSQATSWSVDPRKQACVGADASNKKGEPILAPLPVFAAESLGSARLLRNYSDLVVQHLHEPATHIELAPAARGPESKLAVTQQRHQRRVSGEDSHFTI